MTVQVQYLYDLFVSYADADKEWVQGYLLAAMTQAGVRCISEATFAIGVPRLLAFEGAIQQSQRTLLVLSPAYLADVFTQFTDVLAQSYGVQADSWPVIPLKLHPVDLPPRLAMLTPLDATSSTQWSKVIERLCTELQRPVPSPAPAPPCPYPGMVPFSAQNASFFHGREAESKKLLQRLRRQPLLFVIGPSGSGKSSLVHAGLLTQLPHSSYFSPGFWLVREMRPGVTPLQSLAQLLCSADVPAFHPSNVHTLLTANPPAQRLLLVIDQFEELFTQTNHAEQNQFIAVLKALLVVESCALLIIMRADLYPDLMNSDFWPVEGSKRLEIAPLRGKELRQAIKRPAMDVGVYLEAGLLERLMAEAADEPGVLPLLQETMVLLWSEMQHRLLPLSTYERLGSEGRSGLAVAIARKADATFAELTLPGQQALTRRIFLRLVQFGEGRVDTRRQQSVASMRSVDDDPNLFDRTLRHLVDNRLLTLSGEARDGDKNVDMAHEALIKSWPVLDEWVSERRVAEQTRRRLGAKADEWIRLGRGSGGLLDAAELPEAERWLLSPDATDLGYAEALPALVLASRTAIEKAEQEQIRVNKRLRWRARALGLLFVIAVGFAGLAWHMNMKAQANAQRAERQRQIALARQLVVQSRNHLKGRFDLSLLLSLESNRLADTVEGKSSLLDGLQLHPYLTTFLHVNTSVVMSIAFSFDGKTLASGSEDNILLWDMATRRQLGAPLAVDKGPVHSVAFSPDSRILVSSSGYSTIRLWDMATRQPLGAPLTGHTAPVGRVAFSPDGRMLASGSDDKTVRLWDVATRQPLGAPLTGHTGWVGSVAFSPDGRTLASSSGDGTVRLWDVATRQPLGASLTGHMSSGAHVVFSPDGKTLASDSGKTIILWDMTTGKPFAPPLAGHTESVKSLTFSPDGKTLVSGGADKKIILWDMATRQPRETVLTGHADLVKSMTFSPDGKVLASGSYDKTILVWNVSSLLRNGTTQQPLGALLAGHKSWVGSVAFSPDSKMLASGSTDENVRLWDVVKREALGTLWTGHKGRIQSVTFSPDGKMLASGSGYNTILLWNVVNRERLGVPLTGHTDWVKRVAFSPDGKVLASGSMDKTILLWDVATQRPMGTPLTGHTSWVEEIAFSPDGKVLASGSEDKTIRLWDMATQRSLGAPLTGHRGSVGSMAFSPDGKTLVSGSGDNTIRLWDVIGRGPLGQPLIGHADGVRVVAISPDGKLLASGGCGKLENADCRQGEIHLWDMATRHLLGTLLTEPGASELSLVFSLDGKLLASGSFDGTITLWDVSFESWQARACRIANRNLTRVEWEQYLGVEQYHVTCLGLPLEEAPNAE